MNRRTRYLLVCLLLLGMLPLVAARTVQNEQPVISSPEPNTTVRGIVAIRGTATIANFQFYKVEFGRGPNPTEWHLIGATQSTPVINGVLAQWDTTGLPDGAYTLRLTVVKNDGNYMEYPVQGLIVANKRPTETPTSATPEPTATPLPKLPGPTMTLVILQPTAALAPPTPTPTPERPLSRGIIPKLPLAEWRDAFVMGAGTMLAIFAVIGIVFALRRIL